VTPVPPGLPEAPVKREKMGDPGCRAKRATWVSPFRARRETEVRMDCRARRGKLDRRVRPDRPDRRGTTARRERKGITTNMIIGSEETSVWDKRVRRDRRDQPEETARTASMAKMATRGRRASRDRSDLTDIREPTEKEERREIRAFKGRKEIKEMLDPKEKTDRRASQEWMEATGNRESMELQVIPVRRESPVSPALLAPSGPRECRANLVTAAGKAEAAMVTVTANLPERRDLLVRQARWE